MNRPPRSFWLLAFAVVTAWAMLYFGYRVFEDLAGGDLHTAPRRLAEELVGAWAALALAPALVAVARRHSWERGRRARSLVVHTVALLVYSAAHTLLLAIAHAHLFPLLGLPADSYWPKLPERAAQELAHDVIGYLGFMLLLAAWNVVVERRERALRHAQLESALAEAQLRSLRLQLQPHFLFNALNTISDAVFEDPRKADAMIQNLSELLRLSLRTAPTQEIPLRDELAALSRYTAIMEARFGDRLRVRVETTPEADRVLVPLLLLQPLVENAMRHGASASMRLLEVDVRAEVTDGELLVEISDNGPGADPGKDVMTAGLGLRSTAERLRLLYKGAAELEARNGGAGGFEVRLRLPAREAGAC